MNWYDRHEGGDVVIKMPYLMRFWYDFGYENDNGGGAVKYAVKRQGMSSECSRILNKVIANKDNDDDSSDNESSDDDDDETDPFGSIAMHEVLFGLGY